MPESNSKKKESKRENKLQKQEVSIKVEGQGALRNQKQAKPNEEELKAKIEEEGKSGRGLLKGIVNFIKGIFSATIDMPQKGQFGSSEIQGQWLISSKVNQEMEQGTKKNPEDLTPQAKLKAKEAGEGLKEVLKRSDASNQSIGIKAPDQTPAQDVENSKTTER